MSLKALAAREGWHWRTVYRDVDALTAAGFPIECEDGRHRLPGDWALPNLPGIETDEILAFYVVRAMAGTWRTTAVGKPLDRLWMKLTSGPRGQGALIPNTREPWFAVRSPIAIDYRAHDKIIATLDRAARDRLAVSCRYRALSTKTVTARTIEPGELYWDPTLETLYVIAWCRLRQAVRVFAMHRFTAASLTEETFAPRPEARSAVALKNAFKVWRSENVQTVHIRFTEEAAEEIRERTWASGQRIEEVADGGLVLTMEVAGTSEIERWVLGYGGAAEVLAPEALRERVAALAADAAGDRTVTTGCSGGWKTGRFRWPLWGVPLARSTVQVLLQLSDLLEMPEGTRRARGISVVFSSAIRRSEQGGYGSFAPSAVL